MAENGQRSFGEIFRDAVEHVQEIVRAEIRLAKVETKEEFVKAKGAAIMLGGGAMMAGVSGALLIVAAVCALAIVVPWWASALIMAAVCGIIGGGMIAAGRGLLSRMHAPEKTVQTISEDLKWARNQSR